jgi:hypothetical protein
MEGDEMKETLDIYTLEFARSISWQFSLTCKDTREGRIKEAAHNQTANVLQHYIDETKAGRAVIIDGKLVVSEY